MTVVDQEKEEEERNLTNPHWIEMVPLRNCRDATGECLETVIQIVYMHKNNKGEENTPQLPAYLLSLRDNDFDRTRRSSHFRQRQCWWNVGIDPSSLHYKKIAGKGLLIRGVDWLEKGGTG